MRRRRYRRNKGPKTASLRRRLADMIYQRKRAQADLDSIKKERSQRKNPRKRRRNKPRYSEDRGNSYDRKARRKYLFDVFGTGKTCPCEHCGCKLTNKTMTVDRIVPGVQGGRYTRGNIVPSCLRCNDSLFKQEGYGRSQENIEKLKARAAALAEMKKKKEPAPF